MDISKLEKNVERVKRALKVLPNKSVEAVEELEIHIPKRFEQSNLAEVNEDVRTILMCGVVVGKYYCSFAALTRIRSNPTIISERVIENEKYYILHFYPGDIVIERLISPVEDSIGYAYYIEFIKYSRIPWYADFETIASVMDEAKYYTGKSTGNSNQAVRVLFSLTCRDPFDLDKPFRYSKELNNPNVKPRVIGINNPGQLLSGVFSRLTGGYLAENIIAGSMEENTKITTLEEVIKGIPNEGTMLRERDSYTNW